MIEGKGEDKSLDLEKNIYKMFYGLTSKLRRT